MLFYAGAEGENAALRFDSRPRRGEPHALDKPVELSGVTPEAGIVCIFFVCNLIFFVIFLLYFFCVFYLVFFFLFFCFFVFFNYVFLFLFLHL